MAPAATSCTPRQPPSTRHPDATPRRSCRTQAAPSLRESAEGELSRARQVLTACGLARGTNATWAALTDPARRPPEARTAIDPEVLQHQPSRGAPYRASNRGRAALRTSRRRARPLDKMATPSSCWQKLPRSSRRPACRQTCAKHSLWLAWNRHG